MNSKGTDVVTQTQRVIGYCRVSTDEQADSRGGLDAQVAAITDAARLRGAILAGIIEDAGVSGGTPWHERPGLSQAIQRIEAGEADILAVARIDRLSRSLADFATILERSRRKRWNLLALDAAVDTSTASGELLVSVLASFSVFERRLIGARTREAMAAKRAAGLHMGRRSTLPAPVIERINNERQQGRTLQEIADGLNRDSIATGQGGKRWYPTSIRAVLAAEQPASQPEDRIEKLVHS